MNFKTQLLNFWHVRVVSALLKQLKQGSSPSQLASSLAWGSALGLFPVMGTTTFLCAMAGQVLRLNHVALQLMNYLLFPLHLIMVFVFLRTGDWVWGVAPVGYSLSAMTQEFQNSIPGFFGRYGMAIIRAISVWLIVVPWPALLIRWLVRPWLVRLANKLTQYSKAH